MRFKTIPIDTIRTYSQRSGIPNQYTFNVIMTQLDLIEEIMMAAAYSEIDPDPEYRLSLINNTITIQSNSWSNSVAIKEHEYLGD